MIDIIITSYNEPKATLRASEVFLKSKIKDMSVIVVDPFPEIGKLLKKKIKDTRFKFFLDPGLGKSDALNMVFKKLHSKNNEDIIILTDGDVYVSENSLEQIINSFKNEKIGCVTGKPLTTNPINTKYGYWGKILYDGIDNVRKKLSDKKEFFQCSGYLLAFRNRLIKEIPIDVPEDCVIPYFVWKKGFFIEYLPRAEVYVKYPANWKDWLNQRIRTIIAHENISTLLPEMPRTKSFFNEIKEGLFFTLKHPRGIKEFYWLIQLYFARLYIYYCSFVERAKKKAFNPAWRDNEVKSAKPLD